MVTKSGIAEPAFKSEGAFFEAATPEQQKAIIKAGYAPPVVYVAPVLTTPAVAKQSEPTPKQP